MPGKEAWILSERWMLKTGPGDGAIVLLHEAKSSLLTAKNKGSTPMRGGRTLIYEIF